MVHPRGALPEASGKWVAVPGTGRARACLVALILLVLVFPAAARADRGVLHTEPVSLSEPGQKAFVAFNGEEELLVLATDLRAERDTAVLEFMPFPAEPAVVLAPDGFFSRLQELLNTHGVAYTRSGKLVPGGGAGSGGAVDLLLHQRLGVHDVTVVRVNDPEGFASWVQAYFRRNGFPVRELTEREKAVVADYCGRGFNYFVFDLVRPGKEVRSVPPLAYRFRTPALYYPLKVTSLYGGAGRVELVCCGDRGVLDRVRVQLARTVSAGALPWRASNVVRVGVGELAGVIPEVAELLAGEQWLSAFRCEGELLFRADVWADPRELLVEVNGHLLELDVPPELVAGTCFVPARAVWEALGAAVAWDAARREAVVSGAGLVLRLPVDPVDTAGPGPVAGHHMAYLNGERRDLSALEAAYIPGGRVPEVPLRLVGGRILLPVRFVAGLLGAEVRWNGEAWKVCVVGR